MWAKKKTLIEDLEVDDGTFFLTSLPLEISPTLTQPLMINHYHPAGFEELAQVIDQLLVKKKVIVSLEGLNKLTRIKGLNFLSGAIYALHGFMTKIKANVYELEIPVFAK